MIGLTDTHTHIYIGPTAVPGPLKWSVTETDLYSDMNQERIRGDSWRRLCDLLQAGDIKQFGFYRASAQRSVAKDTATGIPSVRPSHLGISLVTQSRLPGNLDTLFSDTKILMKLQRRKHRWGLKIGDFRSVSGYISETVQDMDIVTVEA